MIKPAPGVNGSQLLAALKAAEDSLHLIRSAGGTSLTMFNAYQQWANVEVRRLGRLVRDDDLDWLVTTPRYWVLQGMDPAAHGDLSGFVGLEVDEQLSRLRESVERITSDLSHWNFRSGLLLVLDTNVYLHHEKGFDEVPWGEVVPARAEGVHLVIPLLVADELDKRKGESSGKKVSDTNQQLVRTRARVTLRRFDELFSDPAWVVTLQKDRFPEAGPVTAGLLMDQHRHVRLQDSDSEIVDRARAVQDLTGRTVYLGTFDTGMAFRARAAGLEVVKMSDV